MLAVGLPGLLDTTPTVDICLEKPHVISRRGLFYSMARVYGLPDLSVLCRMYSE
jgi:hypothetical protein